MRLTYYTEAMGPHLGLALEASWRGTHVATVATDDDPYAAEQLRTYAPKLHAQVVRQQLCVDVVHDVRISAKFRGQGLARRVLRRFLDACDARGIALLMLNCCPTEGDQGLPFEPLLALYASLGFVCTQRNDDGTAYMVRKSPSNWPDKTNTYKNRQPSLNKNNQY